MALASNQEKMNTHSKFKSIRNAFFSGIVLLLPLAATVWIVDLLLTQVGEPASGWLFYFLDTREHPWFKFGLNILSTLIVVGLITGFGFLSRYFIGRIVMGLVERIVTRLPFVKTIYKTTKQIVETFRQENQPAFQKVVLIEYPRPGTYALAFLTSKTTCEPHIKVGKPLVHVFMPTTPNPTTGFLLLLPETDITLLDMSIGDGMKLIISGGAVVPAATVQSDQSPS